MPKTMLTLALLLGSAAIAVGPAALAQPTASVVVDPPRDAAHPARNQQLLIDSHGAGLNALLFVAQGAGPHPTVILLHGLPGNERNLDLAQALRRVGWNVLTFTYRGAWGSPGTFTLANGYEDAEAALAFARSEAGAKLGIDPRRIVLAGHSYGGGIAGVVAARHPDLLGLVLIDAANMGERGAMIAAGGDKARQEFAAGLDDLGNALAGTSPDAMAKEIAGFGARYDMLSGAEALRAMPILDVYATHGIRDPNAALVAGYKKAGNQRVTGIEMDTDHGFADHRIALAQAIADWLSALPAR
jgi:pimeloyl-ACP methyl ester carboxylesterase